MLGLLSTLYLCICVFAYLYICVFGYFTFDTRECTVVLGGQVGGSPNLTELIIVCMLWSKEVAQVSVTLWLWELLVERAKNGIRRTTVGFVKLPCWRWWRWWRWHFNAVCFRGKFCSSFSAQVHTDPTHTGSKSSLTFQGFVECCQQFAYHWLEFGNGRCYYICFELRCHVRLTSRMLDIMENSMFPKQTEI